MILLFAQKNLLELIPFISKMFIFLYLCLSVFEFVFANESCNCTQELHPICASDGRVYKNRCEYDCFNIYNNTFTEKPRYFCTEMCPVPLKIAPVCGSNKKTYVNRFSAECEQKAYPELDITFVPAKKLENSSFIPEYEKCKHECYCENKPNERSVCSSSGQVFKNTCEFHCAQKFWYKKLHLKEVDPEYCEKFNMFAVEIEKMLL
ncbi:serine protease inhibitor dipetalogastin [Harmonia axyridis]|uniref:serine protease inhibitor dipetalogastin n=1 Tax=Harmonia axyridis TaxID=115357 RepID=UPI001E276E15|nr:serine protease inhibitor dipetalogastin [Harmonia axyridis]